MDVSIAVSLIRGQMGAVVERAVNGAVETVLAEMLKVVGVKFEELKAQVALMKRDITAMQREKALKEKENDNIRAKLRYTELKLKYYRQGVEEELQQRASASTLVRIDPSSLHKAQRSGANVSSMDPTSCPTQVRSSEALRRSRQECTSPQSLSKCAVGGRCDSDAGVAVMDTSDLLLPVSFTVNTPSEAVDSSTVFLCPVEQHTAQRKDDDPEEEDCEWTFSLQPHTEAVDAVVAPPPSQAVTADVGQVPVAGTVSADGSPQDDSSKLPSSVPQVKQEAEEMSCIKEEQEVMATLLLDCQVQQGHLPESEAEGPAAEWSGPPANHRNPTTTFGSTEPNGYAIPQPASSLLSMVALPPSAARTWTKDLSLYEEYKLRRNELRRRSLNKRRELEKTLPQPLLADMVRERREKTRLRVARWRAKRKLQACLNQAQALGGAAGLSQNSFPVSSQPPQPRVSRAVASSNQRQSSALPQPASFLDNMTASNSISGSHPFMPSTSTLLLRGPNMSAHQHIATSSSSSYPQVELFQPSGSLTHTDILQ